MKPTGWVLLCMTLGAASPVSAQGHEDAFPHSVHENLFPTCGSCHDGLATGVTGIAYPPPGDCSNCHDGTREGRVDWDGPTSRPSNLKFDHVQHTRQVVAEGDSASCITCHQTDEPVGRMDVAEARSETCLACHRNGAGIHLAADADCRECHVPLVEAAGFGAAWVADLPTPPTHDSVYFLTAHAPTATSEATCAVCHARESCQRCHLNAAEIPAIAQLPADARVAALLIGVPAEYPTPQSHRGRDWRWDHPAPPNTRFATCGNCHAQTSCRVCHLETRFSPIDSMPRALPGGPAGVTYGAGPPVVHPPNFENTHDAVASAAESSCAGCHSDEAFCLDCHRGPGRPTFHFLNYVARHSADAYIGEADCTSCHSTQIFCRGCHTGLGLGSEGRLDVAFHTAKPFWLLGHGESARQGLSSCAACHEQNDCTRCHSAVGAWRVNPHGPDFDGSRWRERNELVCLRCHLQIPGGSR